MRFGGRCSTRSREIGVDYVARRDRHDELLRRDRHEQPHCRDIGDPVPPARALGRRRQLLVPAIGRAPDELEHAIAVRQLDAEHRYAPMP
jgi:hypothetical protein